MAISGFGRSKSGSESGTGGMAMSSGGAGIGNLTAFIDQGSEFEGKLSFRDTVRCHHVEGLGVAGLQQEMHAAHECP